MPSRPRIVLIDPDQETRNTIQRALEVRHNEVYGVATPNEGGSLVMRLKPALVVMDGTDDSGMTLLKNLRRLRRDIPIIGIPGSGGQIPAMLKEGALWAGDKFYITQGMQERPIDPGTRDIAVEFLQEVAAATQPVRGI